MCNESSFFSLFLCQNKGQIFLEPFFFLLGGGEAAVGNMSRSRGLYPLGVQTSTRYLSSAGYTLQKTGLSFRVENDTSGFVSTTEVLFNDPSSSRTCTFEAYEFLTLSFEKATKKVKKVDFFLQV